MAIIVVTKVLGMTADELTRGREFLNEKGLMEGGLPKGAVFDAASPIDGGFQFIDIFEFDEDYFTFRDNGLIPMAETLGFEHDREVEITELHVMDHALGD